MKKLLTTNTYLSHTHTHTHTRTHTHTHLVSKIAEKAHRKIIYSNLLRAIPFRYRVFKNPGYQ